MNAGAARCLAGLLLLGSAAGGCATRGFGAEARERLLIQIRGRGLDPDSIVLPFLPNEEMRHWVRSTIDLPGDPEVRLDHLLRELLHRDQAELSYERGTTATAEEVWRTKKANCLSFTHLYVGLARELDLPVYYLRVSDLQDFEKDGELVVASEHITAAYGPPARRRVLDFTDRPVSEYRNVEPVSDLTAVALFYSNLGAQRIREGRAAEAHDLLRTAVRLDPELGDGWVNLGVAQRRLGSPGDAEASYRRALEANPRLISAYNNLSSMLGRQGRTEEANALLELTDTRTNRNPFSYLALGDLSLRERRPAEAERYYRRARRLDPEGAEPLAALGQAALAGGRRRDAERALRRAEKIDPSLPRVAELARSLRGGPLPD
jgi:tetratricopeptide (TPR) repeat protein